jgi:hypothetical protein
MSPETGAIRYCANGCTRRDGDQRNRVQLRGDTQSRICGHCEDNLTKWLTHIPTNYTLLPGFIAHGTTEQNPESKATKRAEAAAPMRLEVIDLLDTRLGRKWQGLTPTSDRRGVIGTLQAHAEAVQDGRNLTAPLPTHVTGYCAFLRRHLLWIAEQDWVTEFATEMKALNRTVAEAAGIYQRPPVGRCHVPTGDDDTPCGGPLFASDYGGVHCVRCSATWDAAHLRQLGLAQAQQETA